MSPNPATPNGLSYRLNKRDAWMIVAWVTGSGTYGQPKFAVTFTNACEP
jgi:hypothetical protein